MEELEPDFVVVMELHVQYSDCSFSVLEWNYLLKIEHFAGIDHLRIDKMMYSAVTHSNNSSLLGPLVADIVAVPEGIDSKADSDNRVTEGYLESLSDNADDFDKVDKAAVFGKEADRMEMA